MDAAMTCGITSTRAPGLFVSHGSPMFALEPGVAGPQLSRVGQRLGAVDALLVVSPHWQTERIEVATTATPKTLHDFGGFAPALQALRYPAPGAPAQAERVARRLRDAGFAVGTDPQRGLDHGVWVPLRYLRPAADLPVLTVSMPYALDAVGAFRIGEALRPLRDDGIAVIGSGSLTHNLYEFRQSIRDPGYVAAFADWIADAIVHRNIDALIDYRSQAPHAIRAHPSDEHFLPLLVALGASHTDDTHERIAGGIAYDLLSMDAFGFGLTPQLASAA